MKHIAILLFTLAGTLCYAQDKETQAQAMYMAAEEAYNTGNYQRATDKLTETEKVLGSSNAKVEYLRVKSLMGLKKYEDAKAAMSRYFEYAQNNKGTDKYNEMMLLFGQVDDISHDEAAAEEMRTKFAKYVSGIDSMYKKSFFWMRSKNSQKTAKIESVTCRDYVLYCNYSGILKLEALKSVDLKKILNVAVEPNLTGHYDVWITTSDMTEKKKILCAITDKGAAYSMTEYLKAMTVLARQQK